MSIFRSIMSRIFNRGGTAEAVEPAMQAAPGAAATAVAAPSEMAPPAPSPSTRGGDLGVTGTPTQAGPVDVASVMNGLAAQTKQRLDWQHSIVDLMRLLELDSSQAARRDLAQELGYEGSLADIAAMDAWLHRQVMRKLAEHGGQVPEELRI